MRRYHDIRISDAGVYRVLRRNTEGYFVSEAGCGSRPDRAGTWRSTSRHFRLGSLPCASDSAYRLLKALERAIIEVVAVLIRSRTAFGI
jgi:hypothetical protein